MLNDIQELEARLRSIFGAWSHYQLQLWQQLRSKDSAGIEDRIRVANEVLAATHRGEWIWALGGWRMLLGEIQTKLNDLDPHVRQDALIALVGFGFHVRGAVPVLLDRLRSIESTVHDRTLAAWALPKIGADEGSVTTFLAVLDETADQSEAGELRLRTAEAVESLTDSFRVLVPLARRLLRDRLEKCRMHGLHLVERLGERDRRLLPMLVPNVVPLLGDEVDEVRAIAQRIMGVCQS
jgi:hypothetical protein